jgi:hypothetical protein
MNWIDLAQDKDQWRALVITVMNLRVPYSVEKFLSGCAAGGFSKMTQVHEVSSFIYRYFIFFTQLISSLSSWSFTNLYGV